MLHHHSPSSSDIARHQKSSSAVHQLFNPVRGIRDEITRRGGRPKNHILENAKHVKQLQAQIQSQRLLENTPKPPIRPNSLYRNVPSRLYLSSPPPSTTKAHSAPISKPRTLLPILYPADRPSSSSSTTSSVPSNIRKTKLGHVPAYLVQRKQEWDKLEEEKKQEKLRLKTWPPGTVPVPEPERLAALEYLTQSLTDLQLELSKFPITLNHQQVQKYARQQYVLNKIQEVEKSIQVYQQPNVYMAV